MVVIEYCLFSCTSCTYSTTITHTVLYYIICHDTLPSFNLPVGMSYGCFGLFIGCETDGSCVTHQYEHLSNDLDVYAYVIWDMYEIHSMDDICMT